jgi:hypothetical protein
MSAKSSEKPDDQLLIEAAYLNMHADQMERSPVPGCRAIAKELRQQATDREIAHFRIKASRSMAATP